MSQEELTVIRVALGLHGRNPLNEHMGRYPEFYRGVPAITSETFVHVSSTIQTAFEKAR